MEFEKAADWLKMHNLPYWKILGTGGKIVARSKGSDEDEAVAEIKVEDSIEFFRENIGLLSSGRYTLVAKRKPKGNNGEMSFSFLIQGDAATMQPPAAVAGAGLPSMEFISGIMDAKLNANDAKHENEMLKLKHAFEIEKLNNKLKDLKEGGNEDGIGKISNVIQQAITLFKLSQNSTVPSLPAVAKPTDQAPTAKHYTENSKTVEEVTTEKIALAIGELHSVFGDEIGDNMESLAAYAKQNPDQVKMLLSQLRNK